MFLLWAYATWLRIVIAISICGMQTIHTSTIFLSQVSILTLGYPINKSSFGGLEMEILILIADTLQAL